MSWGSSQPHTLHRVVGLVLHGMRHFLAAFAMRRSDSAFLFFSFFFLVELVDFVASKLWEVKINPCWLDGVWPHEVSATYEQGFSLEERLY